MIAGNGSLGSITTVAGVVDIANGATLSVQGWPWHLRRRQLHLHAVSS